MEFPKNLLDSNPNLKKETCNTVRNGKKVPLNILDCKKDANIFKNCDLLWPIKSYFQIMLNHPQIRLKSIA